MLLNAGNDRDDVVWNVKAQKDFAAEVWLDWEDFDKILKLDS